MKSSGPTVGATKGGSRFIQYGGLLAALALSAPAPASPVEMGRPFATPQDAVSALMLAANSQNRTDLRDIFGPDVDELKNPDQVQAKNELAAFASAMNENHRLVPDSNSKYELEVGTDNWPFPVPIVKTNGSWYFDTDAGKDELLNRRIGRNELDVLTTMRAYVDAQREYASQDRNGGQVLEYAQRLASTPGKKDGLYWSQDLGGEISPLGPFVADAQKEGYKVQHKGQETTLVPFHGYYFRILTRQGKHPPGGKYDYIINGHMIGGFAMVAWPAEYGSSGIMTFIVNQQGRVYQRDLGPKTAKLAAEMKEFDPDPHWSLSRD